MRLVVLGKFLGGLGNCWVYVEVCDVGVGRV